jgi:hypothetical protein
VEVKHSQTSCVGKIKSNFISVVYVFFSKKPQKYVPCKKNSLFLQLKISCRMLLAKVERIIQCKQNESNESVQNALILTALCFINLKKNEINFSYYLFDNKCNENNFYFTFMKYLICLFSVVLLFVNCSNNTNNAQETPTHQYIEHLVKIDTNYTVINDTIRLSRITDSLFYIAIGKVPFGQISGIQKILMLDSCIFILENSGLHIFNKNGGFVRTITDECWGFDVLSSKQWIYVAYKQEINIYDFGGDIIRRKIPLNNETVGIGNFIAAIDSTKIAVSVWNMGTNRNKLVIIDIKGKIIKEFPNHQKFHPERTPLVNASRFHRSLFRYHDEIRYHPYYCDTLFSLSNDQLKPIFIENKIFKVPLKYRLECLGNNSAFQKYCKENNAYTTRYLETSRFMIVIYNLGHISQTLPNYLLYDKHTKELYNYKQHLIFENDRFHFGFFNDYDGGLPFNPDYCSGEYLIGVYDVKQFINDYLYGRSLKNCNKETQICTINHYEIRSNCYSSISRQNGIDQLCKK